MTPEETNNNQSASNLGENLWPDLPKALSIRPPAFILKEQAKFLGERTKNILVGEVRSVPATSSDNDLGFAFYIVAPALNNYRLMLFQIEYKMSEMYPLLVMPFFNNLPIYEIENEFAFRKLLAGIFRNEKTVKAIQSLLAQSVGFPAPETTEF